MNAREGGLPWTQGRQMEVLLKVKIFAEYKGKLAPDVKVVKMSPQNQNRP